MHYTHLEDFIKKLYTYLGVTSPPMPTIQDIAAQLGIDVYYWSKTSQALFYKEKAFIFLQEHQTDEQQWQDFCHELCHVLLHAGNQTNMPTLFRQYQEYRANNFMYHACVPTYLLERTELYGTTRSDISRVQQLFNVEYQFAEKRLRQYFANKQNSLYQISK